MEKEARRGEENVAYVRRLAESRDPLGVAALVYTFGQIKTSAQQAEYDCVRVSDCVCVRVCVMCVMS